MKIEDAVCFNETYLQPKKKKRINKTIPKQDYYYREENGGSCLQCRICFVKSASCSGRQDNSPEDAGRQQGSDHTQVVLHWQDYAC